MTRYKIIVNPTSGRGEGGRSYPEIERLLTEYGFDFEMVRTEAPDHAIELAREATAAGFDVIVSAGGDGTANEVLNGLVQAIAISVDSHPVVANQPDHVLNRHRPVKAKLAL